MRKFLLSTVAAVGLTITATAAYAAPITGQISFGGPVSYNVRGNGTTSFDFGANASVTQDTAFGSFAPAFSPGCLTCAVFTDFSYASNNVIAPFQLYTATLGGQTTTFMLSAITSSMESGNGNSAFINLTGAGTLTLTGFDATPGIFTLSTQPGQNPRVSFSATTTATPVPEPASLALLGTSLLGLGMLRRRKGSTSN